MVSDGPLTDTAHVQDTPSGGYRHFNGDAVSTFPNLHLSAPKHIPTEPHLPLLPSTYSWYPFLSPSPTIVLHLDPSPHFYPGWHVWVWVPLLQKTHPCLRMELPASLSLGPEFHVLLGGDEGHNPKSHLKQLP